MSGIANEVIHRDPNAMFLLSVCADIVIALPIVGSVVFLPCTITAHRGPPRARPGISEHFLLMTANRWRLKIERHVYLKYNMCAYKIH